MRIIGMWTRSSVGVNFQDVCLEMHYPIAVRIACHSRYQGQEQC